jgi:thiol-disulfide isomerase/thioredoxin
VSARLLRAAALALLGAAPACAALPPGAFGRPAARTSSVARAALAPGACRASLPMPGEALGALPLREVPGGAQGDPVAAARGRVLLLDVWASWCEPCADTLPAWAALRQELGPRGLEVAAVSVDEDPRQVDAFLAAGGLLAAGGGGEATGPALPVFLDQGAAVAECRLAVRVLPTHFLVDRSGTVRMVYEGASREALAWVRRDAEALLAETVGAAVEPVAPVESVAPARGRSGAP